MGVVADSLAGANRAATVRERAAPPFTVLPNLRLTARSLTVATLLGVPVLLMYFMNNPG